MIELLCLLTIGIAHTDKNFKKLKYYIKIKDIFFIYGNYGQYSQSIYWIKNGVNKSLFDYKNF